MAVFYERLAEVYDDVFALKKPQLNFVLESLPPSPARIVDLGCATGALAVELANNGYDVLGVDLSLQMIDLAKSAAQPSSLHNLEFRAEDMTATAQQANDIDGFLCLGNTLVHLTNEKTLSKFFADIAAALVPTGVFVGQIVNYDRIIDQEVKELPRLVGEQGNRLERFYSVGDGGIIKFKTVLTLKSGEQFESSVDLLALRQADLARMLELAGFIAVDWFGSYNGEVYNPDSFHTIFVARSQQ